MTTSLKQPPLEPKSWFVPPSVKLLLVKLPVRDHLHVSLTLRVVTYGRFHYLYTCIGLTLFQKMLEKKNTNCCYFLSSWHIPKTFWEWNDFLCGCWKHLVSLIAIFKCVYVIQVLWIYCKWILWDIFKLVTTQYPFLNMKVKVCQLVISLTKGKSLEFLETGKILERAPI